jgi:hypothetical protein
MAAVPGALSGGLSVADLVHDPPGGIDIGGGVAGADAGDGFAGGLGEVGEPVGAGGGQLAGVGEQDADVAVGLVAAVAGGAQGGQDRIIVLPGGGHRAQVAGGCGHERGYLPVQSRHSPSERGM